MRVLASLAIAAACGFMAGCDNSPGKPDPSHIWKPDSAVTDFDTLFSQNCRGCHAIGDGMAAGHMMNDPIYLAITPPATMKAIIQNGVPKSAMPAFQDTMGGALTEKQIDIIVHTLYQRYSRPQDLGGVQLPPYSAPLGNAAAGQQAFQTYCASCHGTDGAGGPNGKSVVDPVYLSLVTDQALRTAVIAGRVDFGMPDWRGYVKDKPMSDTEIADVVAWLASKRPSAGAPTFQPSSVSSPAAAAPSTPSPTPQAP